MVIWNKCKLFIKEEDGQTTVEYALILVLMVTIFMQFRGKLVGILKKLMLNLETETDKAFEVID